MIGVLKKIWDFAGEEQDNIRKSMILSSVREKLYSTPSVKTAFT